MAPVHPSKVYICRQIPTPAVQLLANHCELALWDNAEVAVPREVLLHEIENVDGLLTLLTESVDRELLAAAPRLKIVANMAVGYDNIDLQAAQERGVVITNTPNVLTETTADLTFALMLTVARRVVEATEYLRADQWHTWSPMGLTGLDVYGKTLGIIGLGKIGEAVARRAQGFGMSVLYHNRHRHTRLEETLGAVYKSLKDLLQEADFVCILTPLTPDTHHLIGTRELSLMKQTAILINTSRGPVVEEHALYQALVAGQIFGAGLDVFEQEPVGSEHPLVHLPNVVALPHIGSASMATRTAMAMLAASNLVAVLQGQRPLTPVY